MRNEKILNRCIIIVMLKINPKILNKDLKTTSPIDEKKLLTQNQKNGFHIA